MATIADVATLAGVGVGTVSRVLNGSHQVSDSARRTVMAAIDQLGYKPTRTGGANRKRHGLVGVIVPFFDQPSFYQRLRGIVSVLQDYEIEIVLYSVDSPDKARSRLQSLPNDQLDGLIVISLPISDEVGNRMARARCPVVLVDTEHAMLPSLVIDDRLGGQMATEHLVSLGHERIAFVGAPTRSPFGFVASARREQGYADVMAKHGLPTPIEFRKLGMHARSVARQFAVELLSLPEPPTGIVVASDLQALGVIEAAHSLGKSVPKHLSVVGYDDIDSAADSGLTTVRQPLEVSGARGAEIIATAVSNSAKPSALVETLALELVVRTTTGRAAPGTGARRIKASGR